MAEHNIYAVPGEILGTAKELITGDRARDYGSYIECHTTIANFWANFLGDRKGSTIGPADVAVMMALLKCARLVNGQGSRDCYIDGAAYLALAGGIVENAE